MPTTRTTTLAALADLVGGRIQGEPAPPITAALPLYDAAPGCITLVDNDLRLKELAECPAAAVVAPPGIEIPGLPTLVCENPHAAFAAIVAHFKSPRQAPLPGVHPTAVVAATATVDASASVAAGVVIGERTMVGAGVQIHPNVVIGADCRVGDNTVLFANCTLYDDVVLGDRCRIHAGAVIGADGFGYSQVDGRHVLSAQLGGVELGDDVDIGAAATVDRGVYGPTRIGDGSKIDNLVQIAHNCQIGRHNLICSQVGVAGSTTTGDYVVMGGQVGVRDHVHIGAGAMLGAKAGVSNNVADGARVLGAPAIAERDQKLQFAAVAKLPAMRKEFKQMRQTVARLERAVEEQPDCDSGDRAA